MLPLSSKPEHRDQHQTVAGSTSLPITTSDASTSVQTGTATNVPSSSSSQSIPPTVSGSTSLTTVTTDASTSVQNRTQTVTSTGSETVSPGTQTQGTSSVSPDVGLQCVLCTTVSDTGECLDPDGYATCSTSNICIAVNAVFFSEALGSGTELASFGCADDVFNTSNGFLSVAEFISGFDLTFSPTESTGLVFVCDNADFCNNVTLQATERPGSTPLPVTSSDASTSVQTGPQSSPPTVTGSTPLPITSSDASTSVQTVPQSSPPTLQPMPPRPFKTEHRQFTSTGPETVSTGTQTQGTSSVSPDALGSGTELASFGCADDVFNTSNGFLSVAEFISGFDLTFSPTESTGLVFVCDNADFCNNVTLQATERPGSTPLPVTSRDASTSVQTGPQSSPPTVPGSTSLPITSSDASTLVQTGPQSSPSTVPVSTSLPITSSDASTSVQTGTHSSPQTVPGSTSLPITSSDASTSVQTGTATNVPSSLSSQSIPPTVSGSKSLTTVTTDASTSVQNRTQTVTSTGPETVSTGTQTQGTGSVPPDGRNDIDPRYISKI
ncbi:hypothetical protein BSL78_07288 [Apostichopus japonicus]|uniref:Uncharacterized protein n=1 Tax=Stichopus japonicus TaxID=307972 RepID=A0A2G8L6N8_STIJA|nr:hypothetical protein BSL78_07288 [Apostichopus japonicus]